jgi:hypothetical protein
LKLKELTNQQNQMYQIELEAKEKTLKENETVQQLEALEKSLKHIEQGNFQMQEFIATKGKEADFKPLMKECVHTMNELNKLCIASV